MSRTATIVAEDPFLSSGLFLGFRPLMLFQVFAQDLIELFDGFLQIVSGILLRIIILGRVCSAVPLFLAFDMSELIFPTDAAFNHVRQRRAVIDVGSHKLRNVVGQPIKVHINVFGIRNRVFGALANTPSQRQ